MTIKFAEKRAEKKVVYEHFEKCSQFTLDQFWRQVFQDCARGKFPKNTMYNVNNNIFHIKGKKEEIYTLTDDPKIDFQELKRLFSDELNMRSEQDKQQVKDKMIIIRQQIEDSFQGDWKQIRKKNVKDAILRDYILMMEEKYNLNETELQQLWKTITLGVSFNWINDKTILYNDRSIDEITNLQFDQDTRQFLIEKPNISIKRTIDIRFSKLSSFWEKITENPRNRYVY
jgi:hypothetical protein